MIVEMDLRTKQEGYTLIELIMVLAIVALLAAICIPQYANFQSMARLSRCANDASTSCSVALSEWALNGTGAANTAGVATCTVSAAGSITGVGVTGLACACSVGATGSITCIIS
ncbi:MAG: pilin [Dissulfurispiraceae bacterium]